MRCPDKRAPPPLYFQSSPQVSTSILHRSLLFITTHCHTSLYSIYHALPSQQLQSESPYSCSTFIYMYVLKPHSLPPTNNNSSSSTFKLGHLVKAMHLQYHVCLCHVQVALWLRDYVQLIHHLCHVHAFSECKVCETCFKPSTSSSGMHFRNNSVRRECVYMYGDSLWW